MNIIQSRGRAFVALAMSASQLGFTCLPVMSRECQATSVTKQIHPVSLQVSVEEEYPEQTDLPNQPVAVTGWQKEGDQWKYINSEGSVVKNAKLEIDGATYFFDQNGWMIKGWTKYDGIWYFADSSGAMKKGWLLLDNEWYYLNPSDGSMATGWLKDAGKWYYLDPSSGKMQVGWIKDNGKWYFFDSSGAMKTSWLKQDGKWYYFEKDGAMAKGWIKVDNKSYYMTSDGSMAVDTWILDSSNANIAYYVDEDGVWTDTSYQGIPDGSLAEKGLYVGKLDENPYSTTYGFLLKVNGKYGMMNPDGTWLIRPEYDSMSIGVGDEYIFQKDGDSHCLIINKNGINVTTHPGYGGFFSEMLVLVDGKVMVYHQFNQTLSSNLGSFASADYFEYVTQYPLPEDYTKREVYLWSPVTNALHGPFPAQDVSYPNNITDSKEEYQAAICGLVLMVKQSNGTFNLYSPLNTKTVSNLTHVQTLGDKSVTGWKANGTFDVYNNELTLLYSSSILPGYTLQSGSGLCKGYAMVEYENAWYILKIK